MKIAYMRKFHLLITFLLAISDQGYPQEIAPGSTRLDPDYREKQIDIENQILYNGRVWRNLYSRVRGNQFLFTNMFLPGTVLISGKLFTGLELMYDIYNDDLLIKSDNGLVLKLKKEVIDGFTMEYNNRKYDFQNLEENGNEPGEGYFNVLYKGNPELLVKYKKEIKLLAVNNTYDLFNQYRYIYLKKDGEIHLINSPKNIINLYGGNKKVIMNFIKTRRLTVTKRNPESFIPLVEFCESLIGGK